MLAQHPYDHPIEYPEPASAWQAELEAQAEQLEALKRRVRDDLETPTFLRNQAMEHLDSAAALTRSAAEVLS